MKHSVRNSNSVAQKQKLFLHSAETSGIHMLSRSFCANTNLSGLSVDRY